MTTRLKPGLVNSLTLIIMFKSFQLRLVFVLYRLHCVYKTTPSFVPYYEQRSRSALKSVTFHPLPRKVAQRNLFQRQEVRAASWPRNWKKGKRGGGRQRGTERGRERRLRWAGSSRTRTEFCGGRGGVVRIDRNLNWRSMQAARNGEGKRERERGMATSSVVRRVFELTKFSERGEQKGKRCNVPRTSRRKRKEEWMRMGEREKEEGKETKGEENNEKWILSLCLFVFSAWLIILTRRAKAGLWRHSHKAKSQFRLFLVLKTSGFELATLGLYFRTNCDRECFLRNEALKIGEYLQRMRIRRQVLNFQSFQDIERRELKRFEERWESRAEIRQFLKFVHLELSWGPHPAGYCKTFRA